MQSLARGAKAGRLTQFSEGMHWAMDRAARGGRMSNLFHLALSNGLAELEPALIVFGPLHGRLEVADGRFDGDHVMFLKARDLKHSGSGCCDIGQETFVGFVPMDELNWKHGGVTMWSIRHDDPPETPQNLSA